MLAPPRSSLALLSLLALSCDATPASAPDAAAMATASIRPRAAPVEYVGITVQQDVSVESFNALVDPIFGAAARSGTRHRDLELQPGVYLSVVEDPRTADQVVLVLDMTPPPPSDPVRRTVLRVPVSFAYGATFLDAARAALAESNALYARSPRSTAPWHLEYNVTSAHGGSLTLRLDWSAGHSTLTFDTATPRTSLRPGAVNHAALDGEPYETVGGTVNFNLSRDEFAFFSNRAYGITSGAAQNFRDFQLVPHNWLRITVTPRLADQLIDVAFEVVTVDGRRIPFARAPASYIAGDQFQQNVFRLVDNMMAQEALRPGSSTPFTAPFHYDDPEGGGVVRVVATGRAGVFSIAYVVESPTHRLRDVDFLPYQSDLVIPTMLAPPRTMTCEELGSTTALRGRFRVRFNASSTVRTSANLNGPLRGNLWADIYRAADVTITGPRTGTHAVASFHLEDVDITDPNNLRTYDLPDELPAGDYQILGFMDTNHNADPARPDPDTYDPVTLPIGSYNLSCAAQPVTVEFALLLPPGQ